MATSSGYLGLMAMSRAEGQQERTGEKGAGEERS